MGNKDDGTLDANRRRSVLFGGSFVVPVPMAIDTIGTVGTVDAVNAISTIHGSLGSPVGRSVGLRYPSGVQGVVMKQLLCTLAQLGRVKELPDALHVADVVSKSHQPGLVKPLLAQPCGPAVSGINGRPCLITALCQVMDKDDARGTLLAMLYMMHQKHVTYTYSTLASSGSDRKARPLGKDLVMLLATLLGRLRVLRRRNDSHLDIVFVGEQQLRS